MPWLLLHELNISITLYFDTNKAYTKTFYIIKRIWSFKSGWEQDWCSIVYVLFEQKQNIL